MLRQVARFLAGRQIGIRQDSDKLKLPEVNWRCNESSARQLVPYFSRVEISSRRNLENSLGVLAIPLKDEYVRTITASRHSPHPCSRFFIAAIASTE